MKFTPNQRGCFVMIEHPLLPALDLGTISLPKLYQSWLFSWIKEQETKIEQRDICASMCLQGYLIDSLLPKKSGYNWFELMNNFLVDQDGIPIAYSKKYGERLYKFNMWNQKTVHAIHTRWWIEKNEGHKYKLPKDIADNFFQKDGWFYNPHVSPTNEKTRMKSELLYSLLMGTELLIDSGVIDKYSKRILAKLSRFPSTIFISAECFRIKILELLNANQLIPDDSRNVLSFCKLEKGFCDFSLELKKDDYMGTQKRSQWDVSVPSAISTVQALFVAKKFDKKTYKTVLENAKDFARHLKHNPYDIPAFKIREIKINFGLDITPLELIAASKLISLI